MLELLNRYSHGIVAIPLIDTLRRKGCLDAMLRAGEFDIAETAARFGANDGALGIAFACLESIGWITRLDETRYRSTRTLQDFARLPVDIGSLFKLPFATIVRGRHLVKLEDWIARSVARWDQPDDVMADFLDGLIAIPLLLQMSQQKCFTQSATDGKWVVKLPSSKAQHVVTDWFSKMGWMDAADARPSFNRVGAFFAERIFNAAALASYAPMFGRADELLFGDFARVFALDGDGHEGHLDRTLNVQGSGFQHEKYFAALTERLGALFDTQDFEQQPAYIADMGCGDGSLLRRLHEFVRSNTQRGTVLDRHPLTLVAIDFNQKALDETQRTLAGLPCIAVRGDIGRPEDLPSLLQAAGVSAMARVLHVRSFLDHDRPFRAPEDKQAAAARADHAHLGSYVARDGAVISANDVVQSTVEHLRRWRAILGRHGLAVLEVHNLPPAMSQRFLDESESLHFDIYHALSRQYLVPAHTFFACAAEAGLHCPARPGRFPIRLPFTRITLSHFHPSAHEIRLATAADAPSLAQLPPHASCASWDAARTLRDVEAVNRERTAGPGLQFVLEAGGKIAAAAFCRTSASAKGAEPGLELALLCQAQDSSSDAVPALLDFVEQYAGLQTPSLAVHGLAQMRALLSAGDAVASADNQPGAGAGSGLKVPSASDARTAEAVLGEFGLRRTFWRLRRLAGMGRAGDRCPDVGELMDRVGVLPKYRRFIDALVYRLVQTGWIERRDGGLWLSARVDTLDDEPLDTSQFERSFAGRHPETRRMMALMMGCVEAAGEILTGKSDVVDIVFANGRMDTFAGIFHGDAVSDHFNRIVANAAASAVADELRTPVGRERGMRVLEVGGGAGGATLSVLEALAPFRPNVSFQFTDVSHAFLRHASARFSDRFDWVQYALLDIEGEPAEQGFEPGSFDIVIAANVLHDTRRIGHTLQRVASLLKPGGLLLLNEFTTHKDCLLLSGGFLHGYWLFEDASQRQPHSCLLSVPQWLVALESAGFRCMSQHVPPSSESDESCPQCVFICTSAVSVSSAAVAPAAGRQAVERIAAPAPAAAAPASASARADVGTVVDEILHAILGTARSGGFSSSQPLMEAALDSIELVELKTLLGERFGLRLNPAFLFQHETRDKIVAALTAMLPKATLAQTHERLATEKAAASPKPSAAPAAESGLERDPVAVVGIACRLPGGIGSAAEFWDMLQRGGSAVGPLPAQRWDWPAGIDTHGEHRGIDRGGFLDRIDTFDARFFRISPREAELMDPQQRLLLELSWETLEDAGRAPSSLAGRNVGVFVGACHGDYRDVLADSDLWADAHVGTGSAASMLSNRLSYFHDLKGPSITLDTACSSSLVALHDAVAALERGDCEQALVGAVNLICSPTNSIAYHRAGMLSRSGACRAFDAGADGYVRGEGGVMLLLKPLSRALADGDFVHGVVRGVALGHGGQANSLTAPKPDAQAEVIERAWKRAGVRADAVGYIEAHGTGTPLGDPIEAAGLQLALRRLHEQDDLPWPGPARCALGTVKSNMGHLEGAAGLAGVLKALLSVRHGLIPKTVNFQALNPHIDFSDSPLFVAEQAMAWPRRADADGRVRPRCAGVSSFGFGGANAHAVVSEYIAEDRGGRPGALDARGPAILQVLPLSARHPQQLREQASRLLRRLAAGVVDAGGPASPARAMNPQPGRIELRDVAFTLQFGRDALPVRKAFFAASVQDAIDALRGFVDTAASATGDGDGRPGAISPAGPESLREAVARAAGDGDAHALARLWEQGAPVDWTALHRDDGPGCSRVPLPAYPFARVRHWPEPGRRRGVAQAATTTGEDGGATSLHAIRFDSSAPWLADHVIGGERVLPAAAYLHALAAAAARWLGNGAGVVVRDLTLLRRAVDNGEGVTLRWQFEAAHDRGVACRVDDGAPAATPCAQALIEPLAIAAGRLDLGALHASTQEVRGGGDGLYAALRAIGHDYGPQLRAVRDLRLGSLDGRPVALARLARVDAGPLDEDAGLPVDLLDATLQVAVLLELRRRESEVLPALAGPLMPFSIDAFEVHAAFPATAVVRARPSTAWTLEFPRYDLDVCDGEGHVAMRLQGLGLRAAPTLPAARCHTWVPRWIPTPLPATSDWAGDAANAVIVGGTPSQRDLFHAAWPSAQGFAIDDMDGLRHRLRSAAVGRFVCIATRGPSGSPEEVAMGCFRALKLLLAAGLGEQALELLVVTFSAQATPADASDAEVRPEFAAVHGLVGSMAKELPHWRVRLADLEAVDLVQIGRPDEILRVPADADGDAWCRRSGQWLRQGLLEVVPASSSEAPAWRHGGVYVVIGGAGGIGVALTEHLLRRHRAQVVWIGRRPLDARISSDIARLALIGPPPVYLQADAVDAVALRAVRDTVIARFGVVHGLVHSAIVLADKSIAQMDELMFAQAMRAKAATTLAMEQAFVGEPLDFVLMFSSIQSFWKAPGQANYAAGCLFQDAFAAAMRTRWACPVRVMNWGYWGDVGIVASPVQRERMAAHGFGSIEPPQGMLALERLLAGPFDQLVFVKTSDEPMAVASLVVADEALRGLPPAPGMPAMPKELASARRAPGLEGWPDACEAALAKLMRVELDAIGVDLSSLSAARTSAARLRLPESLSSWMQHSLALLERLGLLGACAPADARMGARLAWQEWDQLIASLPRATHWRGQFELVRHTLASLGAVLRQECTPVDVLFNAEASELVENFYKLDPAASLFNDMVADVVENFVRQRLETRPGARLRLLEIGAGTGATSAVVLSRLAPWRESIAEYAFTDISQAFLRSAQHRHAADGFLRTALFDVERAAEPQGIEPGGYDLVIATNVLHATADLRATLNNAKSVLAAGGWLVLNELASSNLLLHLTFGLLDGWWRHDDGASRIAGSPALDGATWSRALREQGFASVSLPANVALHLGQQIVVAASDGMFRVPRAPRGACQPARSTPAQITGSHGMTAPTPHSSLPSLAASERAHASMPVPRPPSPVVVQRLRDLIREAISEALKVPASEIDDHESFSDYGVDSIVGVRLIGHVGKRCGLKLSTTLLFDYPSVSRLADHLASRSSELDGAVTGASPAAAVAPAALDAATWEARTGDVSRRPVLDAPVQPETPRVHDIAMAPLPANHVSAPTTAAAAEPIAIVGMSGRFGAADSLDEFWTSLAQGRDLVENVTRWDISSHRLDDTSPDVACRMGSFLRDIDAFDPMFFNMSGIEATYTDPQQRLLLEQAWLALEDAGYAGEAMDGARCGVYVGCGGGDYDRLFDHDPPPQAYWGNEASLVPARIAYFLNLKGPAIAIDTACSSSLAAVHLACSALRSGEVDSALAGGVFVQATPGLYLSAGRAGMLSPTGHCHAFDDRADGFVPGEGVGVAMLKRLSDALRDGDHIEAVILGSGMNQDGASNGITAPSATSQAELERRVYDELGIRADDISLVEAHGTGTPLGDPIEFEGLTRAFRHDTDRRGYCALGSVKTNVGHLAYASGIAGVAKVVMSMRHGQIPPSLHFQRPNPRLDIDASPFFVNTDLRDWLPAAGRPRCAVVSSFGISGTNVHVVLSQASQPSPRPTRVPQGQLVILSAQSAAQLRSQAERLLAHCEAEPPLDCADVGFTLSTGRRHLSHRLACVVTDLPDLRHKLRLWIEGDHGAGVHAGGPASPGPIELSKLQRHAKLCVQACLGSQDLQERSEHLEDIAELFVAGCVPDFRALHRGGSARRVSLPGYAFARERWWVKTTARALPSSKPALHPLVHINVSTLGETAFESRLAAQDWYLSDHVVAGRPLLSGAAQLELAHEAASRALAGPAGSADTPEATRLLVLRDVVWARPAAPAPDQTLALRVTLRAVDAKDEADFEIRDLAPGAGSLLSKGRASLAGAASIPHLDLPGLREACREDATLDAAACYDTLSGLGFSYGPAHRGLQAAMRGVLADGSAFVLARLTLPEAATGNGLALHPALVDAALQATVLLPQGSSGHAPGMPFSLDRIERFAPLAPGLWAFVRQGASAGLDIDLCADTGQVCVQLAGFATRPATTRAEPAPKSAAAGLPVLMIPGWQHATPRMQGLQADVAPLLIGGDDVHWQSLRRVHPGVRRVESVEALQRDPAALADASRIVWVVPSVAAGLLLDDASLASQRAPSRSCFLFVKLLLDAGLATRSLSLTVLTSQACATPGNDVSTPAHAAVHGVVGAAAKEQTGWNVRLFDLPADAEAWPWETMMSADVTPSGQVGVWRDGQWWRASLEGRCIDVAGVRHHAYRPGSVCVIVGGAGGIGQAISRALIARCGARMIWLGRRDCDASIRRAIDALGQVGPAPVYIRADATDGEQMRAARREVIERFGRIDGLVLAAAELHDRGLESMTLADFDAALSAKLDAGVRLAQVFEDEALDFVLLFSSLSGVAMPAGQANYAAGCAFQNAFGQLLARAWACPVRIVDWGPWEGAGLASTPALRSRLAAVGFGWIEPEDAMAVVDHVLDGSCARLGFARLVRQLEFPGLDIDASALPWPLADAAAPHVVVVPSDADASPAAGPAVGRRVAIVEELKQRVADLLRVDVDRLSSQKPFEDVLLVEFGLDSLQSAELRNILRREHGVSITVQQIMSDKAGVLASHIHEQLLLREISAARSEASADDAEVFVL